MKKCNQKERNNKAKRTFQVLIRKNLHPNISRENNQNQRRENKSQ